MLSWWVSRIAIDRRFDWKPSISIRSRLMLSPHTYPHAAKYQSVTIFASMHSVRQLYIHITASNRYMVYATPVNMFFPTTTKTGEAEKTRWNAFTKSFGNFTWVCARANVDRIFTGWRTAILSSLEPQRHEDDLMRAYSVVYMQLLHQTLDFYFV